MRAAVLSDFGKVPEFGTFALPSSNDGKVVEVVAASIKQLDRAIATGRHYASPRQLPVVVGTDGIGKIDGQLAYFSAEQIPFGSMAERSIASWAVPLPEMLDPIIAAAIVNPALGAWLPLTWRGQMRPGDSVLILGATGATGKLAVSAAKLLGAGRVIAAGRQVDVLAGLGADATINLNIDTPELSQLFKEQLAHGINLVIDYVWGAPAETFFAELVSTDLSAAKNETDLRYVSVGAMANPTISLSSAMLRGARLTILGSGTTNFPSKDKMRFQVRDILDHAAEGRIAIKVAEVALENVAEAWSQPPQDTRLVLRI
jgi:NADPH:quinone reductase-like Zn-dependent oxidoreductase